MGLLTFAAAGGGFVLIGLCESFSSTNLSRNNLSDPSLPRTRINNNINIITANEAMQPSLISKNRGAKIPSFSSLSFVFISVLSFLVILNALFSVFNALNLQDRVGSVLQLQVLAIASLFFLYSVLGLLLNFQGSFSLPSSILDLVVLFGFVEEFFLFCLRRKDTSGIENRYFDLMLVPIAICVVSTVLELRSNESSSGWVRFGRGVGLILQGMWFLQMGLSFYTSWIAHGCYLHEKSRGNYTIKCKGHQEYHRVSAIATLQFNCHLALLVVVLVGLYSVIARRNGYRGDFARYKPLGAEMQSIEIASHFTLDSDEDEIKEEDNAAKQDVDVGVNGYGAGDSHA